MAKKPISKAKKALWVLLATAAAVVVVSLLLQKPYDADKAHEEWALSCGDALNAEFESPSWGLDGPGPFAKKHRGAIDYFFALETEDFIDSSPHNGNISGQYVYQVVPNDESKPIREIHAPYSCEVTNDVAEVDTLFSSK